MLDVACLGAEAQRLSLTEVDHGRGVLARERKPLLSPLDDSDTRVRTVVRRDDRRGSSAARFVRVRVDLVAKALQELVELASLVPAAGAYSSPSCSKVLVVKARA
jgi:hypothetical protein